MGDVFGSVILRNPASNSLDVQDTEAVSFMYTQLDSIYSSSNCSHSTEISLTLADLMHLVTSLTFSIAVLYISLNSLGQINPEALRIVVPVLLNLDLSITRFLWNRFCIEVRNL